MDAAFIFSHIYAQRLVWAILISVCLHIGLAVLMPQWQFHKKTPPPPIEISLSKPEAPKPPEPVQQASPKPPKSEPKRIAKPKIKPSTQKVTPQIEPPPLPSVTPPPVETVIAVAPTKVEPKPVEIVVPPPPEPPQPTGPSDGEIEAAKSAFRSAAHKELKRNQNYPRIAVGRGLEGSVKLEISLDKAGNVTKVKVLESSDSGILDAAAIKAANASNLKQYLNEVLKGRIDSITVTVSFKLS